MLHALALNRVPRSELELIHHFPVVVINLLSGAYDAASYSGGLTTVKDYIASHKHLIPAKRQLVAPQGNRGKRYTTEPGECYQMDWGFTNVLDFNGDEYDKPSLLA